MMKHFEFNQDLKIHLILKDLNFDSRPSNRYRYLTKKMDQFIIKSKYIKKNWWSAPEKKRGLDEVSFHIYHVRRTPRKGEGIGFGFEQISISSLPKG
jgi:hypothetical protein